MNRRLQRGVIILPSAFTLGNLFFGIWAIVVAARGEFVTAAWLVVAAGTADMFDGRVARVTRTGTRFGAELDSLVDAISFGVAPAFIVYHLFLADGHWSWIAAYFYVVGTVVRLARFNVEQAGEAKVAFHGLPSPAAGITLATFHPFSQTDFFREHLARLPWPQLMTALTVLLGILMMSHVLYPVVPKFGFRSLKGVVTLLALVAAVAAALTIPALSFFPAFLLYIAYGIGKAVVLGYFERLPDRDLLLDTDEPDDAEGEIRDVDYRALAPPRRLWRAHLRPRRGRSEEIPPGSATERSPRSEERE